MKPEHDSALEQALFRLKAAFLAQPYTSCALRVEKLAALKSAIIQNKDELVVAAQSDFSHRAEFDTVMADMVPAVNHIGHISRNLHQWMKPDQRSAGIEFFPSKTYVEYVPKGVVGIIAPWNYPVQLSLVPLATAIAAGNKVMVKLSEYTPCVNKVIKSILACLEQDCIVVEGGAEVSGHFSELPFDHMFFTGSTHVGRLVYQACASRLIPCTLELGGKSPAIILNDANIEKAVLDIAFAKRMNGGQICVAPDYVLVHQAVYEQFVEKLKESFSSDQAKPKTDTGLLNDKHKQRLVGMLEQAKSKGVEVWHSKPLEMTASDDFGMHLVFEPTRSLKVMQEEVFGPVLSIFRVTDLEHANSIIRCTETPLACYLYTSNKCAQNDIKYRMACGNLSINDMLLHVAVADLPFGGVGSSGFGQYHAIEGFKTFSHGKGIFSSSDHIWRSKMLSKYRHVIGKILTWLYLR
ncbi:aldehyde dehydrogenase family protein [Pseudoalteromonas sp. SMS1]|uniref:aldehyde dehydrogenase family protein n=1 Tax=Pseudoalteromonas sp. SMS1 TaxID=2908894 RepID=UPI001F28701E|nr:aldehyde dehydrogenase family protein [Pseudoalteromonas sp. SMS1]MCF2856096.1 aldehyde dehydrogenase family protein [Pseudoalteromonas sp. SMS1]